MSRERYDLVQSAEIFSRIPPEMYTLDQDPSRYRLTTPPTFRLLNEIYQTTNAIFCLEIDALHSSVIHALDKAAHKLGAVLFPRLEYLNFNPTGGSPKFPCPQIPLPCLRTLSVTLSPFDEEDDILDLLCSIRACMWNVEELELVATDAVFNIAADMVLRFVRYELLPNVVTVILRPFGLRRLTFGSLEDEGYHDEARDEEASQHLVWSFLHDPLDAPPNSPITENSRSSTPAWTRSSTPFSSSSDELDVDHDYQ